MKNVPWFKCYPRDLLEGIAGLEADEAALYMAAILRMYVFGGPIEYDAYAIGASVKLKVRRSNAVILKLIGLSKLTVEDDGRLFNDRVRAELNAKATLSETLAEAGRRGGRPSSGRARDDTPDAAGKGTGTRSGKAASRERPDQLPLQETAENRQSSKGEGFVGEKPPSHAGARERASESELEDNNNPPLSVTRAGFEEDLIDDEERERLIAESRNVGRRNIGSPNGDKIQEITGRIMSAAKMVMPPFDLALVGGWIDQGIDPEDTIMPTVFRMAGSAKSPIRAMRYFDAEIRRVHAASRSAEKTLGDEFDRIAARHRSQELH